MDRDELKKLLDRQLDDPEAAAFEEVDVTFRYSDEVRAIRLRKIRPYEARRAQAWAVMTAEGGDALALLPVGGLRFCAVDDAGDHLFGSFEQVTRFVDVVEPKSWDAIGEALGRLNSGRPLSTPEDPDAGKDS